MIKKWNPRFVAYAKSNGNTPEQQLIKDDKKFPGGKMIGFMNWISEKKSEFKKLYPQCMLDGYVWDQEKWTEFLLKG
jgi:hypothetical protein